MAKWSFCLLSMLVFTACTHNKPVETAPEEPQVVSLPPEVGPVEPGGPVSTSAPSTVQVNFKGMNGSNMNGMMHLSQEDHHVQAETQMDGLKAGPYVIHLSDTGNCRKVRMNKRHKDLGELMADNNGVVKGTFSFDDVTTNALMGKSIVLHTKDKKPKVVACGVVEKL